MIELAGGDRAHLPITNILERGPGNRAIWLSSILIIAGRYSMSSINNFWFMILREREREKRLLRTNRSLGNWVNEWRIRFIWWCCVGQWVRDQELQGKATLNQLALAKSNVVGKCEWQCEEKEIWIGSVKKLRIDLCFCVLTILWKYIKIGTKGKSFRRLLGNFKRNPVTGHIGKQSKWQIICFCFLFNGC